MGRFGVGEVLKVKAPFLTVRRSPRLDEYWLSSFLSSLSPSDADRKAEQKRLRLQR